MKMLRFGVVGALLLCATAAHADDFEDLEKQEKQAYELLLVDRCAEAIPIFERIAALVPRPRTLVNLGRCEEKTKQLKKALQHFSEAKRVGGTTLTREMSARLEIMIADVEHRIPHVKIFVGDTAPRSTVVKQGDLEIPRATREAGIALDPGEVSFVAAAAGHEAKTFTITIAEGQTQSLTVAPGPPTPPPRPLIEPPSSEPNKSPLKTVGIITMIAGAGALALGGVFGAVAVGKKSSAEEAGCKDRQCPDGNAANFRDDAKAAGTVSTIAFVGGGVLAAAGIGIFILGAPSSNVGLTMSGRF